MVPTPLCRYHNFLGLLNSHLKRVLSLANQRNDQTNMTEPGFSWLLKMAWRDSRRNQGRLLLFISSIILGIGALVAINSFSENLQADINSQAKTLLGADLKLESNRPPTDSTTWILNQFEGEEARTTNFVSMVLFPKNGGTRLAAISSLQGNFPFYGKFNTEPIDAETAMKAGQNALVDQSLLLQFDIQKGDSIQIGNLMFEVAGALKSVPGRSGIASSVAPSVYIDQQYLDATGLIQPGSRIEYQYYFKLDDDKTTQVLIDSLKPKLEANGLRYTTVERRKESIGQAFGNMAMFLNLVGFIALLLGCIGVASAVHIYVKDKLSTVAVLRCIGASGQQSFLIFLIQIGVLGLLGAIVGAVLGSGLQVLLPKVLSDFLPVENVSSNISWTSILSGMFTGLSIALLFALLPLLAIRKTSPLRTLRGSFDETEDERDPLSWVIYALIFAFVAAFTFWQTGKLTIAFLFPVAIVVAFLLLSGIAKLLMVLVRKFFPTSWSYVWRQGIANLYRPQNQTLILIVSIGLGSALIATLFFIQGLLLNQIEFTGSGDQPNMILFNIQSEQQKDVAELTKSFEMPIMQEVPIVAIRLTEIDGLTKKEMRADSTRKAKRWVYNREYRVTYRDTLIESEKIVEGEWRGTRGDDGTIYVSVSENIADDMDVKVGSKLTFNVQGAMVETVIGSIRKIDWGRLQTNFFVVFPKGILEKAPQFQVIVSRTKDIEQSAKYQRALIEQFPNVSVVDLSSVLKSVDDILTKVSFVIRFMALFSILTGLLVLISSVVLSKYQRIKESVLLRTIGAQSRQILAITLIEYFMLGALATLTGIGLAFVGSWLLAAFSFDIPFRPDWQAPTLVFFAITGLTVVIGLFNSREVLNKPPLEVLRR